jgi:DNA-binding beta-propeller fold protein YncE
MIRCSILMPTDIDGPHNITVARDGRSYYVTVAHGTPYGSLWKLAAATDSVTGRAQVELFPTTIGLTPDGQYAFVANSDFHGDHPRINLVSATRRR